jgi:hypothetical protein
VGTAIAGLMVGTTSGFGTTPDLVASSISFGKHARDGDGDGDSDGGALGAGDARAETLRGAPRVEEGREGVEPRGSTKPLAVGEGVRRPGEGGPELEPFFSKRARRRDTLSCRRSSCDL